MQMDAIKVLCVENHAEYLDALRYMLESAGYEVVSARTGSEAVSVLSKFAIEGVLLEYDLPDASGATIRAEMKQIRPEIPVLLFSGVGSQTPFLIKFFAAYLRNGERPELVLQDFDS
jgi:DNA-binding response OmpR family regulator